MTPTATTISSPITSRPASGVDFPILGTDHLEFYVGNAHQAAMYYQHVFGFELVAYRGPQTGHTDGTVSYVVQQEGIRFVLTAALTQQHPVAQHVARHGDGVVGIALAVPDAAVAHQLAVERGAVSAAPPLELCDEHGSVQLTSIAIYGDTVHTFVERHAYTGPFLPSFAERRTTHAPATVGLHTIDHCVGNVALGEMNRWVEFYRKVLGFELLVTFDDADISTRFTALMSKVVSSGDGRVKFPINEPATGLKRSQIEEYLDAYGGPGVQHIALATDDIVHTVDALRQRGVEFLRVPDTYYDDLLDRVGQIDESLDELRRLNILVDHDEEGYLLQIFTQPVQDRPTVFFEIIQRRGARSFGRGNFQALFEAIEREQAARGGL